ncbi:MAG: class I SAM-dependent methyltransferase [Anaerolinea sp.]|nr:class I SAM-dependent methyltransferase [Anaerolinea sp.]
MKTFLQRNLPRPVWETLEKTKKAGERPFVTLTRSIAAALGYNIVRKKDYYSPLPVLSDLQKNVARWNHPSALAGIQYDLDKFKTSLAHMLADHYAEFAQLPCYQEIIHEGFGPGYTELDALTLYLMLRHYKPRRYIEVGSGVSTYYCSLAAAHNEKEGHPLQIQCIEPYPYERLHAIPGIQVQVDEVQNIDLALFQALEAGDVLFIDSSHVLKIDGDVPYLFLEVLPNLQKGVIIHIHDIPFPYNIPYPAETWVLGRSWPMYWTEAMLLQAFLCFNDRFEILFSAPMLRYHDEAFLQNHIPIYQSVAEEANTFSAIWLRKVA